MASLASGAFYKVGADGLVLYANEAACANLGYLPEELAGLYMWQLDADHAAKTWPEFWADARKRIVINRVSRYRRKDGSVFPVQVVGNLIETGGEFFCYFFVQDISEKKNIEAELRLAQFVIEHSAMEIYRIDADGHILYANEQACKGLGYTLEELTRLSIPDIDPIVQPGPWREHWKDLQRNQAVFIETLHKRKDGSLRPIEVSANYIQFDGQEYNFAFVREITERKQAEEQIQRLSRINSAISEISQAVVRMEEPAELFPLVCRCAVGFGGMMMAWVGQLDGASALLRPVASFGDEQNYHKQIQISTDPGEAIGRGPTSRALRENKPIIVNDYFASTLTAKWQAQAAAGGWNSAAAFPITRGGQPFAVLSVYHEQKNAFDPKTIELLEKLTHHVSFALDNFDRENERKQAEESQRIASSVFETSSEGIMVTDAENRIIAVNPAFTIITGYQREEVLGETPRLLKSNRHDGPFFKALWREILMTGKWQGEIWNKRKGGELYPVFITINTVLNENGSVLRRVGLFTDISQKKQSEEVIWHQANYDFLTDLPNRQLFRDRLAQKMEESNRSNLPVAIVLIDLDGFKEVNDTLGHDVGDALLREATLRLTRCVRKTDTVSRLGGDEFTIIVSEIHDMEHVDRIAQDVLEKMSEPFQLGNELAYVTASAGITLYPNDAVEIDDLMKNADQAMYTAKRQGRNRFSYFTASMQEAAQHRRRLAMDLRHALAADEFWLAYQPVVNLKTNTINKAEALVRWNHPVRGLISPAEFIPIAEETGLIIELGDWVFKEAARQVKLWRGKFGSEFQIGINKSPVQFNALGNASFQWLDYLDRMGLPGQSIAVEITEGLLMDANAVVIEKLLAYRDAGIQVALDDFGTGYSSLSYLKKFDIDYLKIDQSFVRNLGTNSDDMVLCQAIIAMAHKLDLKVIAEGVETRTQKDLIERMGCDFAQGYFFSRPVNAVNFEDMMEQLSRPQPRKAAKT